MHADTMPPWDRFQYTYYDKTVGTIWQSIEALDRAGMAAVESLDPSKFESYQQEFSNTICGRHPIAVLMNVGCVICGWDCAYHGHLQAAAALMAEDANFRLSFVAYSQSSKCFKRSDSSVSYAAGVLVKVSEKAKQKKGAAGSGSSSSASAKTKKVKA